MIGIGAVAQDDLRFAVAYLTFGTIDSDPGVRRRYVHYKVVAPGGGRLLRLCGCCREREGYHVGKVWLQAVYAVVGEAYHQREERAGVYAQHLGPPCHIHPVFACAVLHRLPHVAGKRHVVGKHLHLHQSAGLAVEVEAFILLAREVHHIKLNALHRGLLRRAANGH